MDNSRENSQFILAVQKVTSLMDPGFKIAAVGTALLITYFARLVKEHKLKRGEFKSIQEFIKATDGKYFIVNIPAGDGWLGRDGIDKDFADMRDLGIRYKIMPDLNQKDGYEQIMIYEDDRELFNSWYERYLLSKMQGGKHDLNNLKNLTNGKTSIISIPFEGKEKAIFEDFEKLGINYAVLPDLHVGDGEIQLVVANNDMPQVEEWYKLYTADQLKRGIEVPEMKYMRMNEYAKSGEMTEEQYVDTASEDLKKVNEKYEGKEPGEIEKSIMKQEKEIRSQSDAAYEIYHENPDYIEISIDHHTLVEQSHFKKKEAAEENGLFCSRVPGTWKDGKNPELTLVLPNEQVFKVNGGKTYIGFLESGKKVDIRELDGNPAGGQLTGKQLHEKYYDEAIRTRGKKEQMEKSQSYVPKNQKKNFNNFERRNYDFDDLESQILNAAASDVKKVAEKIPQTPVKVK